MTATRARGVSLREYRQSAAIRLSAAERDALAAALPSVSIAPVAGEDGAYSLTPGAVVGAVEVRGLSVTIQPKIGIPHLISLACYADGLVRFRDDDFDFAPNEALPDILALALTRSARRAFSRGPLHGYQARDESLYTVRGRIRFADQTRRRFGVPLPVEVAYDEFTDDVLENRLVKAAAARLGTMRLRLPQARAGLGWIAANLENVSLTRFAANAVPTVAFDRLNERYRDVVGLSRLILRRSEFEARRGTARASGFTIDMNKLFQEFAATALRDALGVSGKTLRDDVSLPRRISLDADGRIGLRPDISWWNGDVCEFVGDAKYKDLDKSGVPNADLYQTLAYAIALNLPAGLLIYAKGKADEDELVYDIPHCGKRLEAMALDLSGDLAAVLKRVEALAGKVRALRDEARGPRMAA